MPVLPKRIFGGCGSRPDSPSFRRRRSSVLRGLGCTVIRNGTRDPLRSLSNQTGPSASCFATAARPDDPDIVPIFEIGQHGSQHCFSTAYTDGESLARKTVAGPMPPRDTAAARLSALLALVLLVAGVAGYVIAGRQAALRRLAERNEAENRQLLYASQIKLAAQAWEDAEVDRIQQILDSLRPQPGQPDLRDWEWHYLRPLGKNSLWNIADVSSFALSPDGQRLAAGVWRNRPEATGVDGPFHEPVVGI